MSCGILGIFASEKQFLLRNLAEKFSLQPTFFLRFFHKGFSEWELIGGASPNANYKNDRGVATIE